MVKVSEAGYQNLVNRELSHIETHTREIEFLKEIHIAYTKDGREFKNLTLAFKFDNDKYEGRVVREDDCFVVYGCPKENCKSVNIRLYAYHNLEYSYAKKEYIVPDGVDESRVIKTESWRVPYYLYNTKELQDLLEREIKYRETWIEEAKRKLEILPKIKEILNTTCEELNKVDKDNKLGLSYIIRELF